MLLKKVNLLCHKIPSSNSDLNQAYLPLTKSLYDSDFFPERGIYFTVLTDDGVLFFCARSQSIAEGIESVGKNVNIVNYFRGRLGLLAGVPLTSNDLKKYGRTTIDFYKIDDENYYLDFSAK